MKRRSGILSRIDEVRGRVEQLEGRLVQLQGQIKLLKGRVKRARGTARVRLARLERHATRQLDDLQATARQSRERVAAAVDTSRRQLERLIRLTEPAVRRALEQARELPEGAGRVGRAAQAGLRAGREAYRRSKRR